MYENKNLWKAKSHHGKLNKNILEQNTKIFLVP